MAGGTPTAKGLTALGRMEVVLFLIAWAALGIVAFVQITAWGGEFDRKQALIASGKVPEQTLFIASIEPSTRNVRGWEIGLSTADLDRSTIVTQRHLNSRQDLALSQRVAAYKFGDGWLIPQFDRGGHNWGRWISLALAWCLRCRWLSLPRASRECAGMTGWRYANQAGNRGRRSGSWNGRTRPLPYARCRCSTRPRSGKVHYPRGSYSNLRTGRCAYADDPRVRDRADRSPRSGGSLA